MASRRPARARPRAPVRPGPAIPTAHERREWARLATDAYKSGRNPYGHRFNAAAARPEMTWPEFDSLMRVYRQWLIGGWAEVEGHASNPRRRGNPIRKVRGYRPRKGNPRRGAVRPAYYTITAYRQQRVNGERVIRELFYTGTRFSNSDAGVVKFPTRELAAKFARYLKRLAGRKLAGWRLRVA